MRAVQRMNRRTESGPKALTPKAHASKGFTLVEILIVVIILGILASIIIGLFSNSSRDAGFAALKDNVRTIRSSIQIYLAQHASYPSGTTFEAQMTQYTDASGNTSLTKTGSFVYGPYILRMPPLPSGTERGKNAVTSMTYTTGYGWQYDPSTGAFRANAPDSDVDGDGVKLNTY
jgi:prepilin-type N-terminal cleavage/methylation domain-containing protein